ncbi:MAG: Gfo/Idh/MocA family oxidoreductase, partial [Armatimonadota bacterium]|nr:Gfo/Idh/MocA family oxidoreductase [Armatimonadota bacterium]
MGTYRVAFIGCGPRGVAHARAYEHIARGTPVACADLKANRREAFAARFGVRPYADAAEMIEREKPHLVHVATRPDARVALLTLVSDLGVPACTVEKPIALGVSDWQCLCALEASSSTRIAVCHQFRWHVHLVRCREALQSGELGSLELLYLSSG